MRMYVLAAAAIVVFATLSPEGAGATTLVALSGERTLTRIDAESRTVIGVTEVHGGKRVVSIDVRPSNGRLYGLFPDGEIAIIDPVTGLKAASRQLGHEFSVEAQYNIDFNPATDRLRIVGTNGQNLKANVETGNVSPEENINHPDPHPVIVAIAHANSQDGAVASQLYGIAGEPEALYLQPLPEYGVLLPIGALGRNLEEFGFDIGVEDGRNQGRVLSEGRLLEVDLGGGAVVRSARIVGLTTGVNTTTRDLTTLRGAN